MSVTLALEDPGFVLGAWGLVAGSLAVYAVRLLTRGRRLSKAVAPEHRRWMHSPDPADRTPS